VKKRMSILVTIYTFAINVAAKVKVVVNQQVNVELRNDHEKQGTMRCVSNLNLAWHTPSKPTGL
jgi:hypothetical protein